MKINNDNLLSWLRKHLETVHLKALTFGFTVIYDLSISYF